MIIPAAFRKKLDSKSKECIFVGYSDNTKGYRLVDPVTKKLQIARDVVFFETQFMSSDNASPFDLNDELQERTTIPIVMKKNLVEINDGQREILQTPVEVGTSLSQDVEERPRRNRCTKQQHFQRAICKFKIYCDTKGALDLSKNPSFRPKTKNVGIRHHFIKEHVASGDIQVERLPSVEMIADILTKSLAKDANAKCASSMGFNLISHKVGMLEFVIIIIISIN